MNKKTKKNLIIRLIVYPMLVVVIFWSGKTFFWKEYAKLNPDKAQEMHLLWMKIRGIEFCETPEEAVRLYAEALIEGDRKKALIYIYREKYNTDFLEAEKRYLYDRTDEQLKQRGERILNGYMGEESKNFATWTVTYNIDGQIVGGDISIWNTDYDGWKIR